MKIFKRILIFVLLFLSFMAMPFNRLLAGAHESENPEIVEKTVQSEIIDGKLYVYYGDDYTIVPEYDIYYFTNGSLSESYYAADVLKNADETSKIVCLTINYNENSEKFDNLNLQIFERDDNIFYNLNLDLSAEAFSLLTDDAILVDENTDEQALGRIKASLRIYSQLQGSDVQSSTDYKVLSSYAQINANCSQMSIIEAPIELEDQGEGSSGLNLPTSYTNYYSYNSYPVNYDDYTSTDGIISSYMSSYFGNYRKNGYISDDPIIRIIPKELCFTEGKHLYIGREYGFFVNTTIDYINVSDYCVDVFVFDIIREKPDFPNQKYEGKVRIEPLFQIRYRAADKVRRGYMWEGYDPALTQVVFPHIHYNAPEYYLRNVSFSHSLENETALNKGETGYLAADDNGAFFVQTRLNYSGVGLTKYQGHFVRDTISYLFGFIDPTKGTVSYLINLLQYGEYKELHESANEENITTYAPNKYYQIQYYGGLLKKVDVVPKGVSDEPVMFGPGHYIESVYLISYFNEALPTRIINAISLDIGVDNTYYYLFGLIKGGSFDTLASAKSYYATSKGATLSNNTQTTCKIEFAGDSAYYRFKPSFTGYYVFETTGTTDTYLRLYDSANTQLAYNDDAGEGLNARITYRLTAGNTYYIKVHGYNYTRTGEYQFSIKYNIYNVPNLYINTPVTVNINSSYEFVLYKFVPSTSGYYTIETTGTADSYLYLYNYSLVVLTSNDDSGEGLNAKITFYLSSGQTYYIQANCYGSKTGNYSLSVRNG